MNQPMQKDVSNTAIISNFQNPLPLVLDPDIVRDNIVEDKHRRLVRSHRNGPLDRDLKPDPKIRDELNVCNTEKTRKTLTYPL